MLSTTQLTHTPIHRFLEDLHAELLNIKGGKVANYIPELTRTNPDWLGIVIVTIDGHIYQVGDCSQRFTIQSISKTITYGMALEDWGMDFLLEKVGVEPSGEAYNSISLEADSGSPMNPMINAGAIAVTGLVKATKIKTPLQRILDTFALYTDAKVALDEKVYRSESNTGHRNRAIAHLLYGNGLLDRPAEEVLDLYFRQCSILVNARDLALMGACLANNGVNPITGAVALQSPCVEKVLSVMSTCGMYDFSGRWIFNVGMPAKSGVGGGIMAVLPGQFGLGVFSPPLDEKGNSVRGIEACKRVSNYFKLHMFNVARSTSASVIRSINNCLNMHSRRSRNVNDEDILAREGNKIHIYTLQGELMFGASESVSQQVFLHLDRMQFVIFDMRRVFEINAAAILVFVDMTKVLAAQGKWVFFTEISHHHQFKISLDRQKEGLQHLPFSAFADTDRALEWCESKILERFHGVEKNNASTKISLEHQYLCTGFTANDLKILQQNGKNICFSQGDTIFRKGDSAVSMFFVFQGEVEISVKTHDQGHLRLNTIGPGMCFGEVSLVTGQQRTADSIAVTITECMEIPFASLRSEIKTKIVINLASHLARKVTKYTELLQRLA